MSYSYFNAKKARKRTKIQQLLTEITIQKQVVTRLASALLLVKGALGRFGDSERWLERPEENEAGETIHVDYIFNSENDPTKQVQECFAKMNETLGPLSRMFEHGSLLPATEKEAGQGSDEVAKDTPRPTPEKARV